MTPPPIRYPLPMLLAILVLGLLAWKGEAWSRPWREAMASGLDRAVHGPPPPASTAPQRLAGPVTRRVLLLEPGVAATDRPEGSTVETIRSRMFADVFDVWPRSGPPTHFRIGNRRAIGWVPASKALEWSSRLTVRPASGSLALADSPGGVAGAAQAVAAVPMPVLEVRADAVKVAAWSVERPWSEVAAVGWLPRGEVSDESWGVWLNRDELLALMGRALNPDGSEPIESASWKAITGRPTDPRPLSNTDRKAVAAWLGPIPNSTARPDPSALSEALARVNEQWSAEASWGGLEFRAVPLSLFPR